MAGYVDSHCHLYFDRFDEDRDAVLARARDAGFGAVVNIGIDVATSRQALELAQKEPGFCFATAGLHPTESGGSPKKREAIVAELKKLIERHPEEFRAVGEIGLDFYWDKASPEDQDAAFRAQLELAIAVDRPVVLHCREAMEECLAVVSEVADRVHGVFHCFSGNADQARRALDLGWLVSFAGNVTYPKATELRAAAAVVDPKRTLLETDAPFLAPQAVRGKRNEPAYALHTGDFLAELYGLDAEAFRQMTAQTARRFFGLPDENH